MARNHLKEDGIFDWSPKDSIPIETKEIKQKFDLGLPIKILDEGKQKVSNNQPYLGKAFHSSCKRIFEIF